MKKNYCTHSECQLAAKADLLELSLLMPTRRVELRDKAQLIGTRTLVRHREPQPRPSPHKGQSVLLAPFAPRRTEVKV